MLDLMALSLYVCTHFLIVNIINGYKALPSACTSYPPIVASVVQFFQVESDPPTFLLSYTEIWKQVWSRTINYWAKIHLQSLDGPK